MSQSIDVDADKRGNDRPQPMTIKMGKNCFLIINYIIALLINKTIRWINFSNKDAKNYSDNNFRTSNATVQFLLWDARRRHWEA